MADWEKYVVPDWVVDDYNSRVPEEDRLPLHDGAGDEKGEMGNSYRGSVPAKYGEVSRNVKWEENTIDRQFDKFLARIMIAAVAIFLAVAIWASL